MSVALFHKYTSSGEATLRLDRLEGLLKQVPSFHPQPHPPLFLALETNHSSRRKTRKRPHAQLCRKVAPAAKNNAARRQDFHTVRAYTEDARPSRADLQRGWPPPRAARSALISSRGNNACSPGQASEPLGRPRPSRREPAVWARNSRLLLPVSLDGRHRHYLSASPLSFAAAAADPR